MPSKVFSAATVGLNAQIIEVEVDTSYGLRCFNIVGLADKAVEESTVKGWHFLPFKIFVRTQIIPVVRVTRYESKIELCP